MKAYERMAELVESAVGGIGGTKIAYVHAAVADEAGRLAACRGAFNVVESLIAELSPPWEYILDLEQSVSAFTCWTRLIQTQSSGSR